MNENWWNGPLSWLTQYIENEKGLRNTGPQWPGMDEALLRLEQVREGNPRPTEGTGFMIPTPSLEAYMDASVDAVTPLPVGPLKLRGIKRHPQYWHGAKGGPEVAENIQKEGFTRGASAELKLPGTSLAEDPTISYRSFTHPTLSDEERLKSMMRVETDVPPEDVYNLTPKMYHTGKVPDDPNAIYRKPNLFWNEAETFARRSYTPEQKEALVTQKNKFYDQASKAGDEYDRMQKDISKWAENTLLDLKEKLDPETAARAMDLFGKEKAYSYERMLDVMERHGLLPDEAVSEVQGIRALRQKEQDMKGRYQEFLDRGDKLDDALKSGGPPPKLRARPLDPKDEQYLERELMYQQRMYAADEELANAMPGEGAKAVRNYVGALSSLRGDRSAFNRGMADFMDIFTRGILYSDSAAEIQRVLGEKKYREFAKRARAMRNTREELKNQDIWEKEPDRAAEMYRAYFRGQDSFLEDLVKETQPLMKRYQKAILP